MVLNFVVECVSLLDLLLIALFVASGSLHDVVVTVDVAVSGAVAVAGVKTATEPFSPFIFYVHALPNWAKEEKNTYSNWLQCTHT